ncbi:transporter substrate-binding domain-containing protein [Erwinia amylovora]
MAITAAGNAFAAGPKTLRIGTDPTYAPFEMKNAEGQLTGFDIDLANEICQRMETKCTFVESDFDALIPSLQATTVDAIISSLSITANRQQEIAFSATLSAANPRLIAPNGSTIQPTLASLRGTTIGLLQGTTQETYANQHWRPQGVTEMCIRDSAWRRNARSLKAISTR